MSSSYVYLTSTALVKPMAGVYKGVFVSAASSTPTITVYDTSGPYTDPTAKIDIRSGLAPIRQAWIDERKDTELLSGPSSDFGQTRLADPKLAQLRFNLHRQPRKAKAVPATVNPPAPVNEPAQGEPAPAPA